MISTQLSCLPLSIIERAKHGARVPGVSTDQVVIGQEAVDARRAAEHDVNLRLTIELVLAHLEGVLNRSVSALELCAEPGIAIRRPT